MTASKIVLSNVINMEQKACPGRSCGQVMGFPSKSSRMMMKLNAHAHSRKSFEVSSGMVGEAANYKGDSTVARTASAILAHFWREIQGFNNWENLVDPLHPLLRQEIIRYGELVTACYKAFDLDPSSKRYLNCRYGKRKLLTEVGLRDSGYQVTKYIYATPDVSSIIANFPASIHQNGSSSSAVGCGKWIGYVAISSDEDSKRRLGRRDIVITFRGTVTNPEWIANFMSSLTPAGLDPNNPRPDVKVESGFLSLYTSEESNKFGVGSCREQLLSEVSRLLNKYKGEELSITLAGHSMGSSLALLLAYDIAELGLNKVKNTQTTVPVTVFSYGGPRVGNPGFKARCDELGVKVLRIVNINDPITKLPGVFFNERFNFRATGSGRRFEFPWSCSCYAHVGVELVLDFFNLQNPSCVHDLETYINLLKSPNICQPDFGSVHKLVCRATEIILTSAQNFDMSPWRSAVGNMVTSVQSLRT